MNITVFYPSTGTWDDFSTNSAAFQTAITNGGVPVRFVDGSYYAVSYSPTGQILLDGQTPDSIFGPGALPVDDRRVQLYSGGRQVADLVAADAFAYAPTSTWDLWKAYYEAAGFTVGRTGTWLDHEVIDDNTPEPLPDDPIGTVSLGLSPMLLVGLGLAAFMFLRKK